MASDKAKDGILAKTKKESESEAHESEREELLIKDL